MLVDYIPTTNLPSQRDNNEVEYHICNMTTTGLPMTPVVVVVMLDGVEVGAVVEGVMVGAQEAEVLVKLAISLNPYLMIVKCHNPTLCLLSMTCEVGNCSSCKKDLKHCLILGCSLIVALPLISFHLQGYFTEYTRKFLTPIHPSPLSAFQWAGSSFGGHAWEAPNPNLHYQKGQI